jgi:outer membrane protein TolC
MTQFRSLVLAGIGLAGFTIAAAEPTLPPAPAVTLPLTLNEAVVRALDANLDISIERLKPQMAEQRRRYALGALDPRIDFTAVVESLERPQNTRDFFATGRAVEVMNEDNIRFEGTLGGTLPTGTRYSLIVKSYQLKNTLNREALSRYYPEYTSNTSFTLTQPLLRGFGTRATLVEADIARLERKSAEETVRGRIDQIAASVIDAYVEAQYAHELVRVITDRIALADRLREENSKRLQQGLMAPIDVMQAESTKAAAEIELVRAHSFQTEAEDRLRELIFADFIAAADTPFQLLDPLAEVTLTESLLALRHLALERSAEYRVASQKVDTEKLRVRYARNQFLPRLDLQGSVGMNGLGDEYAASFKDYGERTQPDYTVGVIASVPITFAQERARLRQALLDLRNAEFELKKSGNHIAAQVQTAHTRVLAAKQRADSAARAVSTAASALDAEEKRLANGLTTSFNVLRLQDQLAQAQINRLEAVAEGQKALAVLWGIVGTLLDRLQIYTTELPGATKSP